MRSFFWKVLLMGLLALNWGESRMSAQEKGTGQEKPAMKETGFYCNLNALTGEERKQYPVLARQLLAAGREVSELPNGYAFRLAAESVSLPDIAHWMSLERKCCPFFDFQLEVSRDNGSCGSAPPDLDDNNCSSITQGNWAFSHIFEAFHRHRPGCDVDGRDQDDRDCDDHNH